ncbi:SDR family NAD(P)-dependent oxidoreductase [Candidatus Nitrosacidococcus tergens]|uniref:Uncharacterized oxidoreductase YbbO n=1 Tax=Candidatus Nitrosacidococcus tergens TaxID=553981 RepID=A0A7G1Q8H1_9GAMM|nr:SDR family NAD(P)-dependent oxidoreductase [Candidatus Nitrosacidococcus tergens]CAB1274744.1 Uncharacterized oxidoreductase YbbO [Candidatus Nitrosacidococcus tergens]
MTAKSVLITGCSSGIGRCTALGLRDRSYRVFATARKEQDIKSLADEGLETIYLDLADNSSIIKAAETVLAKTKGKLYGLFNNGAYGQPGAVEDLKREVLQAQFEANVFGTQELTNCLIPAMRAQQEGRIIYNSSILGFICMPYRGAYNASKYALEGLADTLRLELYGSGIQVSLIEPGPIISKFKDNAVQKYFDHIDSKASPHYQTYQHMEQRLQTEGPTQPFTLPPEAVLKKVIHALESPQPKIRYCVTIPTYAFAILKRILPHRAMDSLLRWAAEKENR